jgi:hypothetical protein
MAIQSNTDHNGFSIKAYGGDAKTLLAFDLTPARAKDLAGFTISYTTANGLGPFYLHNQLQFEKPSDHAQMAGEPHTASVNAPFHKFRWVHYPGSAHQGLKPFRGAYTYAVTPRYFDASAKMLPLDPALSLSVTIEVVPFKTKALRLGFCRGFVQSQAFVNHFGLKTVLSPKGRDVLFDTQANCGTNPKGHKFSYAEAYEWLGYTAREMIFEILDAVKADASLTLDVFAYDFNEPDIAQAILGLAAQGRVRMILDNADLHHDKTQPKLEDRFEAAFTAAATAPAEIKRGNFDRYAHDKVLIVSDAAGARYVLTGSTNFSVTGMYVNSNHVLRFDDPAVARLYAQVFEAAWAGNVTGATFRADVHSTKTFPLTSAKTPKANVAFSPHDVVFATSELTKMAQRITTEGAKASGNVLFAVMQLDNGTGPVFPALRDLHAQQTAFTFGISDSPGGISLYKAGAKTGVLVTGKPGATDLPPPFNKVPGVGLGHQVHHKFVVCGFNGADPTTYCGSSNLALLGEQQNGDNLLAIRDGDVAVCFAIEALALVDHFNFLNRFTKPKVPDAPPAPPPAVPPVEAAKKAGWFLDTNDGWTKPYYDANDLHSVDRLLFA